MWAGTALDRKRQSESPGLTLNMSDMMHQLENVWKGTFSGITKHSWTPISSTPELHLCDGLQEAAWSGDLSFKGAVILSGRRPVAEDLSQKAK